MSCPECAAIMAATEQYRQQGNAIIDALQEQVNTLTTQFATALKGLQNLDRINELACDEGADPYWLLARIAELSECPVDDSGEKP